MIFARLSVFPPALLAGAIGLFSFLVAPTILGNFDSDIAGPVMRSLFPVYYPGLAIIALAGLLLYVLDRAQGKALFMVLILAGFLYQYFYILEVMEELRTVFENQNLDSANKTAARESWGGWHGVSMSINMGQLLIALGLTWFGTARKP